MVRGFCLNCVRWFWCLQSWKELVLGVVDASIKSEKHKIMNCRVFPKWNLKVTIPKRSRIILRSFWDNLLIIFNNATPTHPQTPNLDFSQTFYGKSAFFAWALRLRQPGLIPDSALVSPFPPTPPSPAWNRILLRDLCGFPIENPGNSRKMRFWSLGGSGGLGGHFYCKLNSKMNEPKRSVELFCFILDT